MPISKTISKARPNHPSLDFEVLRTEGIRHLEHLATEVWTDYNAHDPGITMLELLCYAITDLGYRTRMLPVADLMADPNRDYEPWFKAAEVLPTAPVTGMDYRKLLIDLEGVKNAWIKGAKQEVNLFSNDFTLDTFVGTAKDANGVIIPKKLNQVALETYLEENADFGLNTFPGHNDTKKKTFIKNLAEYLSSYLESIALFDELESVLLWQLQYYNDFDNYAQSQIKKRIGYDPETDVQANILSPLRDWNWRLNADAAVIWSNPEVINFFFDNNIAKQSDFERRLRDKIREVYDVLTALNGQSEDPDFDDFQSYFIPTRLPVNHNGPIDKVLSASNSAIETFINQDGSSIKEGDRKKKLETIFFFESTSTSTSKQEHPKGLFKLLELWYWKSPQLNLSKLFVDLRSYTLPSANDLLLKLERMRWKYSRDLLFEITKKEPDSARVNALYRYNLSGSTLDAQRQKFDPWLKKIFCHWGNYPVSSVEDSSLGSKSLSLSGLYTILIDLDEDIDTGIPNCVSAVTDRVKDLLQANRALCEDYVSIEIVEQRPIAVCISLDLAPDTDELEIVAEAVRRMQAYLSPVPRFRTFAQRLAELRAQGRNDSAENIFNGPLLEHGFLVDEELGGNMPRDKYWHSDLLREIMSVPGIVGAPHVKVNPTPEEAGSTFEEKTEYGVLVGDYATPEEDKDALKRYYKPVIDLKRSYFQVTKGARTFQLDVDQIAERLELLRLINSPDPVDLPGGPVWEEGRYRPDLANYRSLQYDLPATYTVGHNRPPLDAKLQRKAQSKHLRAYLAFYDQILASYLAQLGRVKRLLSVDQSSEEPTRVLPLLYEVPGIRDLIGYDAPIPADTADWTTILLGIRDDLQSIAVAREEDRKNDRQLAGELLAGLRTKPHFTGVFDLRNGLKKAFSAHPKLYELYGEQIEDYFWAKYIADDKNRYASLVKEMAESPADQRRRKNKLLDHLIARFGESFGEYAATLLRPQSEPEDNPLQQTFDEYLAAKATFLRDIASLAAERNQAYNYKLFNNLENVADVWNTLNVSGLQKRISRKLGIKGWQTRSLIAEPPYRIDMLRGANNRGAANFKAVLRRRLEVHTGDLNPLEAVPLLSSPPYPAQRGAQNKINELYKSIWQAAYYPPSSTVPQTTDYWFALLDETEGRKSAAMVKRFDPSTVGTKTKPKTIKIKQAGAEIQVEIMLQSDPLSGDEASNLIRDKVLPLVKPVTNTREQEGFHIVEHILLRPKEQDDSLLELHLGCVPEETPRDPYSFWLTVVAPAETSRFADQDFRAYFEQEFRTETPAHLAVRFCYLGLEDMYKFEEVFAVWMFEKAKCSPSYCRVEEATNKLVQLLNDLHCSCGCAPTTEVDPCQKKSS